MPPQHDRVRPAVGGDGGLSPAIEAHPLSRASPYAARQLCVALRDSIGSRTLNGYGSAERSYERWCAVRGLPPWPVDEICLAAWLVHLGTSISVASIHNYASAVKFVHPWKCAVPWACDGSVLVRQALRHLKKKYGMAGKGAKYPVCMSTLRSVLPLLSGWPEPSLMAHDDLMFACASLIATCTFMRGGEFTTCARSTREILRSRDVRIAETLGRRAVIVSIPKPKNAWWVPHVEARGFDSSSAGVFSPVLWLEYYRAYATVPLLDLEAAFQTADGVPLTRDWMVAKTLGQ
jgi:hypothetical protein